MTNDPGIFAGVSFWPRASQSAPKEASFGILLQNVFAV
jgi:hypothetical protein